MMKTLRFGSWALFALLALASAASAAPVNFYNDLYTGTRDNYNGQVGFEFEANTSFYIEGLGRAVNPNVNSGQLQRDHFVRLWDSPTETPVAEVTVTDASPRDTLGYAYESLADPIPIAQGHRYVLVTAEYSDSGDPWYSSGNTRNYRSDLADEVRDAYIGGGNYTGFPANGSRPNVNYGVPTFLAETDDATFQDRLGQNFYNEMYTGSRDNYNGQVGAQFDPFEDFEIRALGRAVSGGSLQTDHTLRLWDVHTQQLLGETVINADSPTDVLGFAQGLLPEPVQIEQGQPFIVTSTETSGSGDPWYSAGATGHRQANHLAVASLAQDAFGGGTGFPSASNWTGDGYVNVTFYGDLPDRPFGTNVFNDHYSGDRNDHEGMVGFRFQALRDLELDRLGRPVSPRFHNGELVTEHRVQLWSDDGQQLLGTVTVGPGSPRDDMGYAFEFLDEHVNLVKGEFYRLASEEFSTGDAGDPWRDGSSVPLFNRDWIQVVGTAHGYVRGGFPGSVALTGEFAYGVPTFYVVPEPGSLLLLALGVLGFAVRRRRGLKPGGVAVQPPCG